MHHNNRHAELTYWDKKLAKAGLPAEPHPELDPLGTAILTYGDTPPQTATPATFPAKLPNFRAHLRNSRRAGRRDRALIAGGQAAQVAAKVRDDSAAALDRVTALTEAITANLKPHHRRQLHPSRTPDRATDYIWYAWVAANNSFPLDVSTSAVHKMAEIRQQVGLVALYGGLVTASPLLP